MNMKKWMSGMWVAVAVAAGVLLPSWSTAHAIDRITLKDGTVVEGEITRELDGYFFIKTSIGGIEQTTNYGPSQITKVERNAQAKTGAKDEAAKTPTAPIAPVVTASTPATPAATGGRKVPKAAVITLGGGGEKDMVGIYITAESLRRAIPMLEQELGNDRSGVVVIRIHSGGGMVSEIPKISDTLQNEYKSRFRTVAWIENAISAAAMSPLCIEEMYFTTEGRYGGCVAFRSLDSPVEGIGLQELLVLAEKFSDRGHYDRKIMRSMQIQDPLSAHVDSNGDVVFFKDLTSGEIIVNREKEILTLNSETAAKIKFSKGTADSLAELTKLMGYQELQWVGDKVKDVPWPVCRAEKMMMDFREQTFKDQKDTRLYQISYNRALSTAQSTQNRDERVKFVGVARGWYNKILAMVRNNPNFKITVFGMETDDEWKEWMERQEKIFRELSR